MQSCLAARPPLGPASLPCLPASSLAPHRRAHHETRWGTAEPGSCWMCSCTPEQLPPEVLGRMRQLLVGEDAHLVQVTPWSAYLGAGAALLTERGWVHCLPAAWARPNRSCTTAGLARAMRPEPALTAGRCPAAGLPAAGLRAPAAGGGRGERQAGAGAGAAAAAVAGAAGGDGRGSDVRQVPIGALAKCRRSACLAGRRLALCGLAGGG